MSCEVRRCPAGLGEVLRGFCESWDLSLARSHICQNMTVKISMRQYHSSSDLSFKMFVYISAILKIVVIFHIPFRPK